MTNKASWRCLPFELKTNIIEYFLEDVIEDLEFQYKWACTRPCVICESKVFCVITTIGEVKAEDLIWVISDKPASQPILAHLKGQLNKSIVAVIRARLDNISPVLVATAARMLKNRKDLLRKLKAEVWAKGEGEHLKAYPWTRAKLECELLGKFKSEGVLSKMVKRLKKREARRDGKKKEEKTE